jgi:hypothetical protein
MYQGWYNNYESKKVSRVAMCEVRSDEKPMKNKPQIIIQWSTVKINGL